VTIDKKISDQARTIVIICPNWVGDLVMATPLFECLRQAYADDLLVAVLRNYVSGILDPNPWFDRTIVSDDKSVAGFWWLIRDLQRLRPEMSIVLPNSMRAGLIARLGGSRKVVGYRRDGRSFLFNGGPSPEKEGDTIKPVPMTHYYLKIAHWLKISPPDDIRPRLSISDRQHRRAKELLARWGIGPNEVVIGLNPGARFGSSKCWPAENFARLAELLQQRWKCRTLMLVGPGEEDLADRIAQLCREEIINTSGDRIDLAVLKPIIKRCQLLITNDTGPRHYAVALGIPVVVIMGPTDPRYTRVNMDGTIVLRHELDCAPCHEKSCPENHECMTAIKPEAVLDAAETLYGGS
jgi:heptosyltransferase-2